MNYVEFDRDGLGECPKGGAACFEDCQHCERFVDSDGFTVHCYRRGEQVIEPMLAESANQPFNNEDFIYEHKLDGVRCIAYLVDGRVRLQSRSGANITRQFPELADIYKQANDTILDGEIISTSFNAIQHRIHRQKELDIKVGMRLYPVVYVAFDILYRNGDNLMGKTLAERKAILHNVLMSSRVCGEIPYVHREGIALFESIKASGGEGIMAKNLNSPYVVGKRSATWLKVKTFQEAEFYICGLTRGENSRESTFGSVILGERHDGQLTYVGNAGSGLSDDMITRLMEAITPAECPFPSKPDVGKEVVAWAVPTLKCEVKYLERSVNGLLRFPTFRRLMEVKNG